MANIINQFNISESNISKSKTKRSFSIIGSTGSNFMLQVVSSENKFYNFKTKTFTTANLFNAEHVLKDTIISSLYNGFILFPAVTGNVTYKVILKDGTEWAVPHDTTNRHYQEILEWVANGGTIVDNGA